MARQGEARRFRAAAQVVFAALIAVLATAADAHAGPGYEVGASPASIATALPLPHGLAFDQVTQTLYVTELAASRSNGGAGQIEKLSPAGTPEPNSPFHAGGSDFFAGVAVSPADHSVFAYQVELETPFGTQGTAQMNVFSPTGALEGTFTPAKAKAPQIATDAAGRVFLPNDGTANVQVFDAAGSLEDTISCTGCPGGAFSEPASVAFDSGGDLYVVDRAGGGRVLVFEPSGGTYVYSSVLQSGRGAVSVGVDPVSDDVLVGDLEQGSYHVVAYDSSGVQFDDFGGGTLSSPEFGALGAGQIVVNATTRKVYVADSKADKVRVFDRVGSIPAPVAATSPASSVGQVEANLNATVDPNNHGLTECRFHYTDHADFLANGFSAAETASCPFVVGADPVPTFAHLSGLTPGTEYHFKVSAATNGGSSEGTPLTFTTLPPLPPDVSTGSASSVAQTSATLGGAANPRGGSVSDCHFEYIDAAGFAEDEFAGAASEECLFTPYGTSAEPVTASVSGLTADTEYRFRVVVTNNSGTGESSAGSFTTLADTCETKPELCPPPEEEPDPPTTQPPSAPPPTIAAPPAPAPSPAAKRVRCRHGFAKKKVHGKTRCLNRCRRGFRKKKVRHRKPRCVKVKKRQHKRGKRRHRASKHHRRP